MYPKLYLLYIKLSICYAQVLNAKENKKRQNTCGEASQKPG